MRISLLQYPIIWTNKAANLDFFETKLAAIAGQTDLAILPEMFSTGFCTNQPDLAESIQGTTSQRVTLWAKKYQIAIIGSFMATNNGNFYNRAFFAKPTGELLYTDKRHLFSIGNEAQLFTTGKERNIIEYMGVNFLVQVCYDIRFPVWSRNKNNEYDVLIYVANFPAKRINDWDILLAARAIENQAYVCGVNCVGTDGLNIQYNGHSTLLDYKAQKLISFADNEANTQTAKIDIDKLHNAREKFPIWRDADEFKIL